MLRFTSLLTVILLIACATTTWAQDTTYVPDHDRIGGTELVAVYIGAESCGPCQDPELKQAISQMKILLDRQAPEHDWTFSAMGVALDWEVATGYEFLQENGRWDEVIVGKNWTNLGASHFLWADTTARPAIPQVVLLQREVDPMSSRIAISDYHVLTRHVGPKTIREWVNDGASVQQDQ